MRDFLRSLPVFENVGRGFDTEEAPERPEVLFDAWLRDAIDHGVPEPHAMTLSTNGTDGVPDARVLLLKDLDDRGWWFATSVRSAKGEQLAASPFAALAFYWPAVGRQIRVRGPVAAGSEEESAADFQSRGATARALALIGRESRPLTDRAAYAQAVAEQEGRIAADSRLVAPGWRTWAVQARTVEFWQADQKRLHTRLRYTRRADGWTRELLWP